MTVPIRVLMVEDSTSDAKLVLREIRRRHPDVEHVVVETEQGLRDALRTPDWDIVISDWQLPQLNGLRALAVVKELHRDLPLVIVSGTIGEEIAVEAMRAGARDYVLKDRLTRLTAVVERELRERRERDHHRQTEQALRRAEEQLRQAQKMEAIGNLAGGIAHDFNNLLSVILGYSSLIASQLRAGDPMADELRELVDAANRGADLTRRLLAFGRRQVLQPKILRLDDVISSVEGMLRRVIPESITLTVLSAPRLGHCKLDPGQLEQVILNLVVNARDAMPDGGKLTIEMKDTEIDLGYARAHMGMTPGNYVTMIVTDTGAGMDRETQARIFEPFFTTKGHDKGSGLGLSMVFGIVQQSGGHIWVYSEVGVGTSFKLHFPRVDAPSEPQPTTQPPPRSHALRGTETVLIVEDDAAVRGVVSTVLRRAGYTVVEASNGGEALLICEQEATKLDLMLTDVVMPRMNGRQLADRLKTVRPNLKVIFSSGYPGHTMVQHGDLEAGVDFLAKPASPDALLTKVREVLDRVG